MSESCRCNKCLAEYLSDEELEMLEDDDGFFKGCVVCKTDAYLTDLNRR